MAKSKLHDKIKVNINLMSNKGGVGKSEITIAVVSLLRNPEFQRKANLPADFKVAAFTGDTVNSHAVTCLGGDTGDAYTNIVQIDLGTREGADKLLNMVDTYPDANVLLTDFPANSLDALGLILDDPQDYFDSFEEEGYTNYVVLPLDAQPDSLASIIQAANLFGAAPHYIVAVNPRDTTSFKTMYEEYSEKKDQIFEGKKFTEWNIPTFEPLIKTIAKKEGKGTCYQDIDIHPLLKDNKAVKIRHRRNVAQMSTLLMPLFV